MKPTIYLAGGFSDWRKHLISKLSSQFILIDPSVKEEGNTLTPKEYVNWDLHMIRQADMILAYAERTNKSLIGLACEVGYAKGLGYKTIVTIIEPDNIFFNDKYLKFIEEMSDVNFKDLTSGINYLKNFK